MVLRKFFDSKNSSFISYTFFFRVYTSSILYYIFNCGGVCWLFDWNYDKSKFLNGQLDLVRFELFIITISHVNITKLLFQNNG